MPVTGKQSWSLRKKGKICLWPTEWGWCDLFTFMWFGFYAYPSVAFSFLGHCHILIVSMSMDSDHSSTSVHAHSMFFFCVRIVHRSVEIRHNSTKHIRILSQPNSNVTAALTLGHSIRSKRMSIQRTEKWQMLTAMTTMSLVLFRADPVEQRWDNKCLGRR